MTNVVINYSCLMNQIVRTTLYVPLGGLKNRGTGAMAFVLFVASSNVIRCSTLNSKNAAIVILQKFLDSPPILCHNQRDKFISHLINIIYNCFFSAQTKTITKQLSKIKKQSLRETTTRSLETPQLGLLLCSVSVSRFSVFF